MQVNPVPLVQLRALFAALQLGIEKAVVLATEPVTFARTVFAATVARSAMGIEWLGKVTDVVTVKFAYVGLG